MEKNKPEGDSMRRRTKIVCTMGPRLFDENLLEPLMRAGMDVARFNFSHSNHEEHLVRLKEVVRMRENLGLPIATMLDTKGPEIRTGDFEGGRVTLETSGGEDALTLMRRMFEEAKHL